MKTAAHKKHLASRVSHNDCQECRADVERRFLRPHWPGYQFVTDYLGWAKPRLEAIREGEASPAATHWRDDFRLALNRRINLKVAAETGRKQCDSYLQRLGQFPRATDSQYLRRFARRGASTLH